MPQPEFKSPTHNCEFNKKVHNLLLEAVSEKDHKFFANSAGDVEEANDFKPEMYANVTDCDGDAVEDTSEFKEVEDSTTMFFGTGFGLVNWKVAYFLV